MQEPDGTGGPRKENKVSRARGGETLKSTALNSNQKLLIFFKVKEQKSQVCYCLNDSKVTSFKTGAYGPLHKGENTHERKRERVQTDRSPKVTKGVNWMSNSPALLSSQEIYNLDS